MAGAIRPQPVTIVQNPQPQVATPAPPVAQTTTPATTATSGGGTNAKSKPNLFQQVFGIDLSSAMFVVVGVIVTIVGLVLLVNLMSKGQVSQVVAATKRVAS